MIPERHTALTATGMIDIPDIEISTPAIPVQNNMSQISFLPIFSSRQIPRYKTKGRMTFAKIAFPSYPLVRRKLAFEYIV